MVYNSYTQAHTVIPPPLVDDECYMSEKDRNCYLLANVGDIIRGTIQHKTTLKWDYGQVGVVKLIQSFDFHFVCFTAQFEERVLDVALSLISTLTADECRSPVGVARGVVSMIVTRDNKGVLLRGSGATGATHPCRWNGSTLILQKYHRTNTPVRSAVLHCVSNWFELRPCFL